jgi:hypothetical protein
VNAVTWAVDRTARCGTAAARRKAAWLEDVPGPAISVPAATATEAVTVTPATIRVSREGLRMRYSLCCADTCNLGSARGHGALGFHPEALPSRGGKRPDRGSGALM